MEQGANALLISHTRDATLLPPTLPPPPLTVAARSAKGRGTSAEIVPTTFAKGVTAGARGTLSPTCYSFTHSRLC